MKTMRHLGCLVSRKSDIYSPNTYDPYTVGHLQGLDPNVGVGVAVSHELTGTEISVQEKKCRREK
jgi:hypothetical protein